MELVGPSPGYYYPGEVVQNLMPRKLKSKDTVTGNKRRSYQRSRRLVSK